MSAAWLDGKMAGSDDLRAFALANYGHFTTMQVRGLAVRGLGLHLQRLQSATRELFDETLDIDATRRWMAEAARVSGDCGMRATVAMREDGGIGVLVTTSPAGAMPDAPMRVRSLSMERHLPHLKHVGIFAQSQALRAARDDGFDDALLLDRHGHIAEGTFWNIVFSDGEGFVWPDAPALAGVTARLLGDALAGAGVPQARRAIGPAGLGGLAAAYAMNARGIRGIAAIDGHAFPGDATAATRLHSALGAVPWEPLVQATGPLAPRVAFG